MLGSSKTSVRPSPLSRWLWVEKLNNPLGFVLLTLLGLVLALTTAKFGLIGGGALILALIGVILLIGCLADLRLGISVILAIGYLTPLAAKYTSAPVGTLIDGILALLAVGLLMTLIRTRNYEPLRNPISIAIAIWVFYNIMEIFNPLSPSFQAWAYAVRPLAFQSILFYVCLYAIKDIKVFKVLLKVILGIAFIAAAYGLKQEFIGFSDTEMSWLHADPLRYMLINQWSRLRIFSFFSDPTTFGIVMVLMAMLAFVIMTGPISRKQRILLGIAIVAMLAATAYAGSRTPIVLLPIGLIMYITLNFNKQTFLTSLVTVLGGAAVMMKSTSSAVMYRIQSSFNASSLDTINVRISNQKILQPLIQDHPFGLGLASIGEWGKRFNTDKYYHAIAHDSGYVRIAAELGWVGLIIYMAGLMTIATLGIRYYFRVKDPFIKTAYLGINCVVFMLIVANYPQEAIVMLPISLIWFILVAAIIRLKDFDPYYQAHYAKSK